MNQMVRNTTHGQGITKAICSNQRALFSKCKKKFLVALDQLKDVFQLLDSRASKPRTKRCIMRNGQFKVLKSFETKHVYPDQQFNNYWGKQVLDANDVSTIVNKRGPYAASRNTIIKQSDANALRANSVFDRHSGRYISNNPVNYLQVDTITGVIQKQSG